MLLPLILTQTMRSDSGRNQETAVLALLLLVVPVREVLDFVLGPLFSLSLWNHVHPHPSMSHAAARCAPGV
jgi:hypothetical protein